MNALRLRGIALFVSIFVLGMALDSRAEESVAAHCAKIAEPKAKDECVRAAFEAKEKQDKKEKASGKKDKEKKEKGEKQKADKKEKGEKKPKTEKAKKSE